MNIAYKKAFSFIILFSLISLSHAFVSNHDKDNDVTKRVDNIDKQLKLIANELTLQSAKSSEVEILNQLKDDLITEKESLKNGIEFYRSLETKASLRCSPPSFFIRVKQDTQTILNKPKETTKPNTQIFFD